MSHYENLLAVAQRAEKNTGKEFKVSLFNKEKDMYDFHYQGAVMCLNMPYRDVLEKIQKMERILMRP